MPSTWPEASTVLATTPGEGGVARTSCLRAIDVAPPLERTLVAEIDPDYLFGDASTLPAMTDICVSDESGRPLYCSTPTAPPAAAEAPAPRKWIHIGDVHVHARAGRRPSQADANCSSRPWFPIKGWTVLAVRPEAEALVPGGLIQEPSFFRFSC